MHTGIDLECFLQPRELQTSPASLSKQDSSGCIASLDRNHCSEKEDNNNISINTYLGHASYYLLLHEVALSSYQKFTWVNC